MAVITIDFSKTIGKVMPNHGIGQPPFRGLNFSLCKYLKEAGIPFSRLHDVGGDFGGNMFVDIPNIFREWENDPENPNSYDFGFTDLLITALIENSVEPFFRLGVSIENYCAIKAYRIFPPKDNLKWAKICEGIIRHYTEGFANGFHYNIRYWEIWNEPDNDRTFPENQMWAGTKEEFYELYVTSSKYLKEKFPHLKIGGYGSCGFYDILCEKAPEYASVSTRTGYFIEFLDGFLERVKKENAPLDFFSWHSYDSIENNEKYAYYIKKRMIEAGFENVELFCNEWNLYLEEKGSLLHASYILAMMLKFTELPLDGAMFYDAQLTAGKYGSLIHPLTYEPLPEYYAFLFYGEMYKLGSLIQTSVDESGVYVAGAKKEDKKILLISNTNDFETEVFLKGVGNPKRVKKIAETQVEEVSFNGKLSPCGAYLLEF